MRCLLIDNYDSFTWNLADLIGRAFGEAPVVVRNDDYRWPELRARGFDCVVISPGPGSPAQEADFHVSARAIAETTVSSREAKRPRSLSVNGAGPRVISPIERNSALTSRAARAFPTLAG